MISRKGEERIASGPVIEKTRVDLACGNEFGSGDGWIYLDYHAWCGDVRRGDLLGGFPWADGSAALVYSSHFLGHIPRSDAPDFFARVPQVLAPVGVLRLMVLDLAKLCRAYVRIANETSTARRTFSSWRLWISASGVSPAGNSVGTIKPCAAPQLKRTL